MRLHPKLQVKLVLVACMLCDTLAGKAGLPDAIKGINSNWKDHLNKINGIQSAISRSMGLQLTKQNMRPEVAKKPSETAVGSVDAVDLESGFIHGWASDPDWKKSIAVLCHINGNLVATATANLATESFGPHGFSCAIPRNMRDLTSETTSVTVYAVGVDPDGTPDQAPLSLEMVAHKSQYTRTMSKRLPTTAYSNVLIWPLQEYYSFFHDLLPNSNQKLAYKPTSNFGMYAERDLGGWNNIRMGYEMAVSLAYKFGRPLALPQGKQQFYLVDSAPVSIFDYFDENHFKQAIPTTPYFEAYDKGVFNVPKKFSTSTTNKEFPGFDQLPQNKHWYFGDSRNPKVVRLFGQYTERPEFQPVAEYVSIIHQAFRIRRDIIDKTIANLKAHNLKPHQYVAMHVRRNDFQYDDVRHVSHEEIVAHVAPFIKDEIVLIVSDEYNEDLKRLVEVHAERVVFWRCDSPCPKDQMVVDMVSCVPAKRFFGSPLSTFSAGILQWRNRLLPDVSQQYTMPYRRNVADLPTWARAGELVVKAPTGSVFKNIGYETLRVHKEVLHELEDLRDLTSIPWSDGPVVVPSSQMKVTPLEIKRRIMFLLKPLVEQWTGIQVEEAKDPVLRRYFSGATLPTSEKSTAAFSVILVVQDKSDKKPSFPVQVTHREGRKVDLAFGEGYMLFVASGTCPFGREKPLQGQFVDYIATFDPVNYNDCGEHC